VKGKNAKALLANLARNAGKLKNIKKNINKSKGELL